MKVLKVDHYRLTNDEAITYYVDLRYVVNSYSTLKVPLEKVFVPFANSLDLALKVSKKVDISPINMARTELKTSRANSFLHLRGAALSALRSSDVQERQHAQLVVNTIKLHGWKMQSLPSDKFSSKLSALLSAFDAENLKESLAYLGLAKALSNLKDEDAKFLEADRLRTEAWADRDDVSLSKALKSVMDSFSNVTIAIDGLLLTSDDPLLQDMVEKMNVITEAKQQTLKAKATRAENARKASSDNGTNG